jgi:hypothetical protein
LLKNYPFFLGFAENSPALRMQKASGCLTSDNIKISAIKSAWIPHRILGLAFLFICSLGAKTDDPVISRGQTFV